MNAAESQSRLNLILSDYDTCSDLMNLIVNSITPLLDEISLTNDESSGVFRYVDETKVCTADKL